MDIKSPNLRAIICSAKTFISLVKNNLSEPDPIELIKRMIAPEIMPCELEKDILDLWNTTLEHCNIVNNLGDK